MPLIVSAFAAGLLFGLGLIVSQMVNPAKVLGFLDIFGAWDPKAGAVGSLWDVVRDRRLNHRPEVVSGVLADECGRLLVDFFDGHR